MRLQHRNIIRLFGVVVYNDPILIVTEYAPGLSCQSMEVVFIFRWLSTRSFGRKEAD